MEIRVVGETTGEKDFSAFVASHPKGHVLQTLEWGEVKRSMGWEPIPLALYDGERVVAAILILKRRLPIPLVRKSIFYAPRGPVGDIEDWTVLDELFSGVRKVARRHGAIFLKIDPDVPAQNLRFKEYLTARGFRKTVTSEGFEGVQPTYVFRLDITPTEEDLVNRMASKTRYNIRLAQRKGVAVRLGESEEDLKVFYDLLKETAERDRFLIRGYSYFLVIWRELVKKGLAQLFLAEYQGRTIAGTLAFILGDKAWYIYGASANECRNVMPNYLLQWTMIRWAKASGCKIYDFRGVSGDVSEDNPLFGLYRFKKGFGGDFTEFVGEWDLVFSPVFYWLWTKILPLYYQAIRKIAAYRKRRDR